MSIGKQQIDQTIAQLSREFPKCLVLFERQRRPLKLGIHLDIIAALGEQINHQHLAQALRYYTSNLHYRMSQRPGVPRIDLDGNVSGVVSEADAQSAAKDVARRKAAFRERQQPEPEIKPVAPPPPEPRRRDSLACVRPRSDGRRLHEFDVTQLHPIEIVWRDQEPTAPNAANGKCGR